jgi:hypothetical protein
MAVTTYDVAQWLETRYHIMQTFYNVNESAIAKSIEESLGGALESLMGGHTVDPWGSATQQINSDFRDFISSKKVESVGIMNVPTFAALKGVNHRLKHPYARGNPRRPSFRDTGLYLNSFRSWVD